jgi:hypothetical protein
VRCSDGFPVLARLRIPVVTVETDPSRRRCLNVEPSPTPLSNRNPDVDAWFEHYDNPLKALVQEVRDAVLDTDDRVGEVIKWQAPTFVYKGNIASFFPKSKKHVTLMFHQGASIDDPLGLLEGDGPTSRSAKFTNSEDLAAKREALRALIANWITSRDA